MKAGTPRKPKTQPPHQPMLTQRQMSSHDQLPSAFLDPRRHREGGTITEHAITRCSELYMSHTFVLREQIIVNAPLERCFLLSTSTEIVERELGMHPVRGKTSGLIGDGETVRWEGWQLGFPNFHESIIEHFERNVFFRDRMIDGRFRALLQSRGGPVKIG